ncbi:hypothetical protein BBP40_003791 [Aspergillus hancockii]|nr:hypothetical protein BBP40_003791 [Aspergillus hancockii]
MPGDHIKNPERDAPPCDEASGKSQNAYKASYLGGPDSTTFSLSLKNMATGIEAILKSDSGFTPSLIEPNSTQPISVIALQHFINCSTETVGNPSIREVMKSDMIRVSFASPYLMYTILAVGTLHLNRIAPENKIRQYAETYYWGRAIKLYQEALTSSVTRQNVDHLLSTCMFMGIVTLCPENIKPTDSWVLSNKPDAMNWLCLQSGLKCIIDLAGPYLDSSIWCSAFQQAHNEEVQIYEQGVQQGRDGLNPDLADLCGVDEFTTAQTNPYYEPLRLLAAIFQLERNFKNAAQCASFMGRLGDDFLALLRIRDPPALLILAHWMGLMCTLSSWQPWIEGRVRAECIAICMYLEHSMDPTVIRLLQFPASASGYYSSPNDTPSELIVDFNM